MAAPATTNPHGGDHGHAAHHLSAAPLILGLGALIAYIGFGLFTWELELTPVNFIMPVGILIILTSFFVWIKEDIQFWAEDRQDPGVSPGRDVDWWAMIWFLGTEVMLFGGLFAAFFVMRAKNPDAWLALDLPVVMTGVNTLILLTSGLTMHYALHAIQQDKRRQFIYGLVATIVLGAIFLAVQVYEYVHLIHEGFTLDAGPFASIFYMVTGTHGFHVFLGLVFLLIVLVRALKGQFTAERHVAVDAFAIYWHFVDVVWILLFFVVYVGVI